MTRMKYDKNNIFIDTERMPQEYITYVQGKKVKSHGSGEIWIPSALLLSRRRRRALVP